MHANDDGGAFPIATEGALANEQTNKEPEVELGRSALGIGPHPPEPRGTRVGHRELADWYHALNPNRAF
jgi:hypothetical protein